MPTYEIETDFGTLSIDHDGPEQQLVPAVSRWVNDRKIEAAQEGIGAVQKGMDIANTFVAGLTPQVEREHQQMEIAQAGVGALQQGMDVVNTFVAGLTPQVQIENDAQARSLMDEGKGVQYVEGKGWEATAPPERAPSSFMGGVVSGIGKSGSRAVAGVADMMGLHNWASETRAGIAEYEAKDEPKGAMQSIGTGVGGAALLTRGGLPSALTQAGATAFGEEYQHSQDVGKALVSTAKTVPEMAAYWLLGAGAAKAAQPFLQQVGPMAKASGGAIAAGIANMLTSTALRAINAPSGERIKAMKPTAEGVAMDAFFGLVHGMHSGMEVAKSEGGTRKALSELPTDLLRTAAADPEFRRTAPYNPLLVDQELARRESNPQMQEANRVSDMLNSTADQAEATNSPATAAALRASAAQTQRTAMVEAQDALTKAVSEAQQVPAEAPKAPVEARTPEITLPTEPQEQIKGTRRQFSTTWDERGNLQDRALLYPQEFTDFQRGKTPESPEITKATQENHKRVVADALANDLSVNADAVALYGLEVPIGYVREGSAYVKQQPQPKAGEQANEVQGQKISPGGAEAVNAPPNEGNAHVEGAATGEMFRRSLQQQVAPEPSAPTVQPGGAPAETAPIEPAPAPKAEAHVTQPVTSEQQPIISIESPKASEAAVVGNTAVRASKKNAGKIDNTTIHPSLIAADGTRKPLYHGKGAEFVDKELKIKSNSMTTLSGLGPAWFTTNKYQAKRFSVPKGNIMEPESVMMKRPLVLEGDKPSVEYGRYLRELLDIDRGVASLANIERYKWTPDQKAKWEEWFPKIKRFLEERGVKKLKAGDKLDRFSWAEVYPITSEFSRQLDSAKADTEHPDADPFHKLRRLEKEARVTLRLSGDPRADKMPAGEAIRLALQSDGYDGVVLLNTMADTAAGESGEGFQPSDWAIPFTPEQVIQKPTHPSEPAPNAEAPAKPSETQPTPKEAPNATITEPQAGAVHADVLQPSGPKQAEAALSTPEHRAGVRGGGQEGAPAQEVAPAEGRIRYRVPTTGAIKRFIKQGGRWFKEVSGKAKGKALEPSKLIDSLDRQLAQETKPVPPPAPVAQPAQKGVEPAPAPEPVRGVARDIPSHSWNDIKAGLPKQKEFISKLSDADLRATLTQSWRDNVQNINRPSDPITPLLRAEINRRAEVIAGVQPETGEPFPAPAPEPVAAARPTTTPATGEPRPIIVPEGSTQPISEGTGPRVISTALNTPEGIRVGTRWNQEHSGVGVSTDYNPDPPQEQRGFLVQKEDGSVDWVDRKEAGRYARAAGQTAHQGDTMQSTDLKPAGTFPKVPLPTEAVAQPWANIDPAKIKTYARDKLTTDSGKVVKMVMLQGKSVAEAMDATGMSAKRIQTVLDKTTAALQQAKTVEPMPKSEYPTQISKEARQDEIDKLAAEEAASEGPGAAATSEFPSQKTTALKRGVVDVERVLREADPIPTPERAQREVKVRAAEDAVDADPTLPKRVIAQILDDGRTAITDHEAAVLLVGRMKVMNERTRWEDVLGREDSTPAERAEASGELLGIEPQLERFDRAQRAAGSGWSDLGRMYQNVIKEDFTLDALERKKRAIVGRPLTEAERDTIKAQAERIAELESKAADLQKQTDEKVTDVEVTKMIEATINELGTAYLESGRKAGKGEAGTKRPVPTVEKVSTRAKAEAEAGDELSHKTVFDLVRAIIASGIHGEDAVMAAAHAELVKAYPGLTERDVRRAYSEYGQVRFPSKEAISVEMRELRTLVRLQESIDRETAGLASLHTGLQRDKATQSIREKQKRLNELLKKRKGPPSPEQLATRNEARLTNLRNRIEDLDKELRTGEKQPKGEPIQDTPEIERLKAELGAMRDLRDEIEAEQNPPPGPEEKYNITRAKAFARQLADLQARLNAGDFSKPVRPVQPKLNAANIAAKAEVEKAKLEIRRGQERDRLAKRGRIERTFDGIAKWRRTFVLTGLHSLAKLTSAAIEIIGIAPIEEAIGGVISKALPSIAERAPRHGRFGIGTEVRAVTETWRNLFKDAASNWKTGNSELDLLYGRPDISPPELKDFIGRTHGALKSPAKRNEFTRSFENRIGWAASHGVDVTDPLVQMKLRIDAYRNAESSIFLDDNMVVDMFKRAMSRLRQVNKETGKPTATGKIAETLINVALPIVRIPTNIVARTFEYSLGTVSGSARIGRAGLRGIMMERSETGKWQLREGVRRGIEELHPDEADAIIRNLKRGSLGAAVMALGFFSPNAIQGGGYYVQGVKRKEGAVPYGGMRIFGYDVPRYLVHNPLLEQFQIGATIRDVMNSKVRKSDKETRGAVAASWAAFLGLLDEVPFVRQMSFGERLASPEGGAKLAEGVALSAIPQLVQERAKEGIPFVYSADRDSKGNLIKRKPTNLLQSIEMGIPGLRKNVPVVKPTHKR